MIKSIRIDIDIPLKMRDGITLRGDVFRPDDSEKHPAIIVRTPYDKMPSAPNNYLSPIEAAFARYAVVIQDTRGRFASKGEFVIGASEGPDGCDTVECCAAEPWCDGHYGDADRLPSAGVRVLYRFTRHPGEKVTLRPVENK